MGNRQQERLTWDDIYYLHDQHNLGIGDIQNIQGYENFEITSNLEEDDLQQFEQAAEAYYYEQDYGHEQDYGQEEDSGQEDNKYEQHYEYDEEEEDEVIPEYYFNHEAMANDYYFEDDSEDEDDNYQSK